MARPRKELDMEALKRLCQIQCTQEEMAWFFGMSVDTIKTRIREQFEIEPADKNQQGEELVTVSSKSATCPSCGHSFPVI